MDDIRRRNLLFYIRKAIREKKVDMPEVRQLDAPSLTAIIAEALRIVKPSYCRRQRNSSARGILNQSSVEQIDRLIAHIKKYYPAIQPCAAGDDGPSNRLS